MFLQKVCVCVLDVHVVSGSAADVYIDSFLKEWKNDYKRLERVHSYIQWYVVASVSQANAGAASQLIAGASPDTCLAPSWALWARVCPFPVPGSVQRLKCCLFFSSAERLFPLREPGVNYMASELTKKEIEVSETRKSKRTLLTELIMTSGRCKINIHANVMLPWRLWSDQSP